MPCATTAATDWYFAAGTTVRGVTQWLVLENPFAADARVDVTLRTDAGLQELPSLTGLDVPGRSRVVIPIHDEAVRRGRVSRSQVHATVGRVVASQTIAVHGGAAGAPGVATSIGAVEAGERVVVHRWRHACRRVGVGRDRQRRSARRARQRAGAGRSEDDRAPGRS